MPDTVRYLVPDDLIDRMCDAMLDPTLGVPHPTGRPVRRKVLDRAFAVAAVEGWVLVHLDDFRQEQ